MHPHPPDEPRASWIPLILLAVAQFMVVLDITIVNVALPSIGEDVGLSGPDLQWVVTVYVLLTGGLLLLGGRLADVLERRRRVPRRPVGLHRRLAAERAGRDRPATLIAARALQGVGAALLTPAALSLVTGIYAGRQRTRGADRLERDRQRRRRRRRGARRRAHDRAELGVDLPRQRPDRRRRRAARRCACCRANRPAAGRSLDLPGALLVVGGLVVLVYAIEGARGARLGLGPHARARRRSRSRCWPPSPRVEALARQPLMPPAVLADPLADRRRRADAGRHRASSSARSS